MQQWFMQEDSLQLLQNFQTMLIIFIVLPYLVSTTTFNQISAQTSILINSHTSIYNYTDFILMLPYGPAIQSYDMGRQSKQVLCNILKLYPRNFQTLFLVSVPGYGLQEMVSIKSQNNDQNLLPKYITIKQSDEQLRWVRKNIYLNLVEDRIQIFKMQFSDTNEISMGTQKKLNQGFKWLYHENTGTSEVPLVQGRLSDFIDFYFSNRVSNPQRIKNLALFIQVDSIQYLNMLIGQLIELATINKLKIQTTIVIGKQFPNKTLKYNIKTGTGKIIMNMYKVVIKEKGPSSLRYALLQQKQAVNRGIAELSRDEIFILSIQKQ